ISFPPLGEEDRMEGPMIIEAEIGEHFVNRMYVEGGSFLEILYEHCFNRFCPKVKSQLVPVATPLVGFRGEIIWPLEQISLLIKIGDEEHSTSTWMNFMVVRSPSPYNRIIRRPGSSRIILLECTMVLGTGTQQPVINQVTKEKFKLCGLLRRNLDIFVWKPMDMTGVSRQIKKHRLNIHEGFLYVRQKKRGQAPERNKAICEEVEKLVNAGIMKEVHYHSWLSNLVMVKKHDDSWRMCVDF
ncbi:hypothetical protein Tco_1580626, partial [Tanacetum coccineum]